MLQKYQLGDVRLVWVYDSQPDLQYSKAISDQPAIMSNDRI